VPSKLERIARLKLDVAELENDCGQLRQEVDRLRRERDAAITERDRAIECEVANRKSCEALNSRLAAAREWLTEEKFSPILSAKTWASLAALLAREKEPLIEALRWTKVSDKHPPRGGHFLARSSSFPNGYAVATVCYGLHDPWWCSDLVHERAATYHKGSRSTTTIQGDDEWLDLAALGGAS
jgi:hypothetical protein